MRQTKKTKRQAAQAANNILRLARADLAVYATAQWPPFELAELHRIVCTHLEAVESGKTKRLMIFLPPRHGKSRLSSQIFPAWYLGRHPDRSIIAASYSQDLADDFGRSVRNFVSAPLHTEIFPQSRLAGDSASLRRFNLAAGGSYFAVGRGGPITGRGAHLLIIDDPLKDREEASSAAIRKGLHDWFSFVAYTRLQPGGAIVLIQTRWHELDLCGWLLSEHREENWEVISLPAIAEQDETFRKAGEALWPEKFPLEDLERIRASIGGAAWTSLYMQRPAAAEGALFKREWFRHYTAPPDTFEKIIQSWDTAAKKGAENDYSVCTTWARTKAGFFLLNMWRAKVEFPELKRQFSIQAEQWKPSEIIVEDKASGTSLIQELRTATSYPVIPVAVDADKVTRANAVTGYFEAGRVFFPEGVGWLAALEDELAVFPAGRHDDIVDSITQALNRLRDAHLVLGLVELQMRYLEGTRAERAAMELELAPPKPEPKKAPENPPAENSGRCPECNYHGIAHRGATRRCGMCGHEWFVGIAPAANAVGGREALRASRAPAFPESVRSARLLR